MRLCCCINYLFYYNGVVSVVVAVLRNPQHDFRTHTVVAQTKEIPKFSATAVRFPFPIAIERSETDRTLFFDLFGF